MSMAADKRAGRTHRTYWWFQKRDQFSAFRKALHAETTPAKTIYPTPVKVTEVRDGTGLIAQVACTEHLIQLVRELATQHGGHDES